MIFLYGVSQGMVVDPRSIWWGVGIYGAMALALLIASPWLKEDKDK